MKKKPALFAVCYLDSDRIRYAIQDERERYWTWRGFSKDRRKALAYADEVTTNRDMRRIPTKYGDKLTSVTSIVRLMSDSVGS